MNGTAEHSFIRNKPTTERQILHFSLIHKIYIKKYMKAGWGLFRGREPVR
jgi:hypothetical protein